MKLIRKGKFWLWEETDEGRAFDEKILKLERAFSDTGKSIWGTDGCEKCGACCYEYQIRTLGKLKDTNYSLCPYQNRMHRNDCMRQEKKPRECKKYGCWKREYRMGTPAERYAMMRMAVDILKTKTEKDIISLVEKI
jgi:hypothetical protein